MPHLTIPPHSARIVRKTVRRDRQWTKARATGVPSHGHAEWKTLDIYPDNVSRITKQLAKQLDGIELVRLRRETRDQKLCFSSRPFVLCGLPFRPLPKTQLLYERRNGHFALQIAGHPDYGVPFGQDRLVPIFLATLAIQQKTSTIRFKTAAEMLDIFGMSKGVREYRRLIAAFERIFGATILFGTDTLTSKSSVVKRTRFNFFSEAQIWYHGAQQGRSLSEGDFENVIVLSTEFYEEVIAHPIPTDFEVVRILSSAPAILDLFVWLSYLHRARQRIDSDFRRLRTGPADRDDRVYKASPVSTEAGSMAADHPTSLAGMPRKDRPHAFQSWTPNARSQFTEGRFARAATLYSERLPSRRDIHSWWATS